MGAGWFHLSPRDPGCQVLRIWYPPPRTGADMSMVQASPPAYKVISRREF